MSEYCVLVADVGRARIFTLEAGEVPDFDSGPHLVERKSIANPLHKDNKEATRLRDTRLGAHREHVSAQRQGQRVGIPHHNYDDHREGMARERNRDFAQDVVEELEHVVQDNGVRRVILCGSPQAIGYLRPQMQGHLNEVDMEEVQKDLSWFSAHDLHEKLASDGYLPPRQRGAAAEGWRGPGAR